MMPIGPTTPSVRSVPSILVLLSLLALAGCDDVLVRPARDPVPVALSIAPEALRAAAGVSDAYDAADRVRVLVLASLDPRQGEALLDTTLSFAAADSVRVALELPDSLAQEGRELTVGVVLQADTAPLFAGADAIRVRRSAAARAEIRTLVPVVARFALRVDRDTLDAPGDTTRVRVAGLFATGDTVPPEFVSVAVQNATPGVIEVGPLEETTVLVTGLAPGMGRVVVRSTSVRPVPSDSVAVVVREPAPAAAVFEQVVAGGAFACGRDAAGAAWCWGSNAEGTFGNGTTVGSSVPVPAGGGRTFTKLAAGARHACGVEAGGALFCWGSNDAGQLGNGTRTSPGTTPTVVAGIAVADVAAGEEHTCAVTTDGRLFCWGSNADGRAGAGAAGALTSPARVDSAADWVEVSAGTRRTCALKADASVWCFGHDADGALGDGVRDTGGPIPRMVDPQVSAWWAVSMGATHACGIQVESSQPFCWGRNDAGQMGLSAAAQGDTANHWVPELADLPGQVSRIDAGRAHTCTVRLGGTVYCFGDDSRGQLGRGNPSEAPAAGDAGWDHVDASLVGDFTCARRDDGATYCWGANALGQLGNGTMTDSAAPVPVTPPQASNADRRGSRPRS